MLLDKIQSDLKSAQLARQEVNVSTLRLLLAEIKNAQIQKGEGLNDSEIVLIVQKEIKKRKEAASAFRLGSREEQALAEESESQVLAGYLPAQLSNEELTKIIETTINEMGATSISDMGKVIGSVMAKVKGQAEGGVVSSLVKEKLTP